MAILRNQRTYPLNLKSATQYALNAGVTAAYDFQGDPNNAYAGGDGVPHVGSKAFTKPVPNATLVQVTTDISGRDPSAGRTSPNTYTGPSAVDYGIGSSDGLGAFTIHKRMRTPTSVLQTWPPRQVQIIADGTGAKCVLYLYGSGNGTFFFRWEIGGQLIMGGDVSLPASTLVDVHLTRSGDLFTMYVNGQQAATLTRTNLLLTTSSWAGSAGNTSNGMSGSPADNLLLIDDTYWNRALSAGEVFQHQHDPYAGYTNTAIVPDGVTVTNPFPNATINSEGATIAGYYSGATVPTGIEYRFNGGAWAALTGLTLGGGSFAGTTAILPNATTGLLEVRFANATTITTSVANVTAKVPNPTVVLVSQPPPDGQSQSFSVTTTRATSVDITLVPTGSGATQGPTTFPITSNAAAAILTGIPAGDYTVAITGSGPGGATTIAGNPISILGVAGGGVIPLSNVLPVTPTVSGVTVSPATATLAGGAVLQFTSNVSGNNAPSQAGVWTAGAGNVSGTGLFTAPAASTIAQVITVTFTSDLDKTKSGSALVTVPAIVQPGPGSTIQLVSNNVTIQQNTSSGGAVWLATVFTSDPAPYARTIPL